MTTSRSLHHYCTTIWGYRAVELSESLWIFYAEDVSFEGGLSEAMYQEIGHARKGFSLELINRLDRGRTYVSYVSIFSGVRAT